MADTESFNVRAIKIEEKGLENDLAELKKVNILLGVVLNNTTSDKKNAVNKAAQLCRQYRKANNNKRKIHFLYKLIEYIDDCRAKGVLFDYNNLSAINSLRGEQKSYRDDLRRLPMNFEDNIESLCNRCISLINSIENHRKNIENYKKNLDDDKNELDDDKKKEQDSSRRYGSTPGTYTHDAPRYSSSSVTRLHSTTSSSYSAPSPPVKSSTRTSTTTTDNGDNLGIKSLMVYDIDTIARIQLDRPNEFYTDDYNYRITLKKYFNDNHLYGLSRSIDTVVDNYGLANKVLKTGHIRAGINYDPCDILEYALNVYNNLPLYLEKKHLIDISDTAKYFFNKFNIEQSLETYEKMYNKYMKAYSFMTKKNKEYQNRQFSSFLHKYDYELAFGKKSFDSPYGCMVTPEELRRSVNNKIISDMSKKSKIDVGPYFSNEPQYVIMGSTPQLSNITRYMDNEEVARLYKTIERIWNPKYSYSSIPINQERVQNGLKIFQYSFVCILVEKMYAKDIAKLSDEELEEFIRSKYDEICYEILKDESYRDKSKEKSLV